MMNIPYLYLLPTDPIVAFGPRSCSSPAKRGSPRIDRPPGLVRPGGWRVPPRRPGWKVRRKDGTFRSSGTFSRLIRREKWKCDEKLMSIYGLKFELSDAVVKRSLVMLAVYFGVGFALFIIADEIDTSQVLTPLSSRKQSSASRKPKPKFWHTTPETVER